MIDDSKNLCGILSEKDCLCIFANGSFYDMPGGTVSRFMTDVVSTVTPTTDLLTVADIFLKHNFRRMLVVEGKNWWDKSVAEIYCVPSRIVPVLI